MYEISILMLYSYLVNQHVERKCNIKFLLNIHRSKCISACPHQSIFSKVSRCTYIRMYNNNTLTSRLCGKQTTELWAPLNQTVHNIITTPDISNYMHTHKLAFSCGGYRWGVKRRRESTYIHLMVQRSRQQANDYRNWTDLILSAFEYPFCYEYHYG